MTSDLALDGELDTGRLHRSEHAENFPVALRVLPRRHREALRAIYGVARFVDDVGDDPQVDAATRLGSLELVRADLLRAFAGEPPRLAVVRALAPVIASHRLRPEPFLDLVEANVVDQTVRRYASYDDLLAYCALSANPVGRLVLAVFGIDDATAEQQSDSVCTALQLLEHCQDVVEDLQLRDRVYLPAEDLARFGITDTDIAARRATPSLRQLVEVEVDRAAVLLDDGRRLVGRLHGWARLAVAGYVAGGLATVDAIRRAGHDVVTATPGPRGRDVVRHAVQLMRRSS